MRLSTDKYPWQEFCPEPTVAVYSTPLHLRVKTGSLQAKGRGGEEFKGANPRI